MPDDTVLLAELTKEVHRLTDLEAIYRLRLEYYSRVNECDYTSLPDLFADNAEIDFGNLLGRCTGRAGIAAALQGLEHDAFVKLLAHGHVASVEGDHAHGHLFVEGRLVVQNESFIHMGKVDDTYIRTRNGWRIATSCTSYYFAVPLAAGWAVLDNCRPFASP
ncbi:nuclear transport factor 2 family protein [Novosphingobium sp. PASSN1]|uniref:nuclear transport factor 2 family protein n=1 Tax=Novosphingobium sp. PASSN1 TaxID=2015561 RepID=UPI0025F6CA32|nr:nuclear transport factor 2 family protein [Novosphingobium sp. PASSN1]